MNMNQFSGLEAGCCNNFANYNGCGCGAGFSSCGCCADGISRGLSSALPCPYSAYAGRNERYYYGNSPYSLSNGKCGCGCGCGCGGNCCANLISPAKGYVKIVCVDENCNGVCHDVFRLTSCYGCPKTIDLGNNYQSRTFSVLEGISTLECIDVPCGFLKPIGNIYCDCGFDSCGHSIVTVKSDGIPKDHLSVRREVGVTVITLKLDRVPGTGCGNGCCCSAL